MRRPILAGNWKMNQTPADAIEFVRALRPRLVQYLPQVETVVCPPFICLPAVADALAVRRFTAGERALGWSNTLHR